MVKIANCNFNTWNGVWIELVTT